MHFPHYYLFQNQIANSGDSWDGWITVAAFLAVLVAIFGERFWAWWRRPIIEASFNHESERCFRWAIASPDFIFDQGNFEKIKRQYFRLKVSNRGLSAVRGLRAKVELCDTNKSELADRFEPNALNWVTGSGAMDLASGEYDYINLISQALEPDNVKYKLRIEVANYALRGITWDRYLTPHKLQVTFYAENLPKPVIKFFKFTPPEEGEVIGKLEETSGWN